MEYAHEARVRQSFSPCTLLQWRAMRLCDLMVPPPLLVCSLYGRKNWKQMSIMKMTLTIQLRTKRGCERHRALHKRRQTDGSEDGTAQ